jgi:hypothetical protein
MSKGRKVLYARILAKIEDALSCLRCAKYLRVAIVLLGKHKWNNSLWKCCLSINQIIKSKFFVTIYFPLI